MDDLTGDRAALERALAPDYTIEREIGRGGMGIVYRARDVKLDRPVAIKVLPPHLAGAADIRERFLREARTAARLAHPNIVPIHRADDVDGRAFFVMALVEGASLADILRLNGRLPPATGSRILADVARALAYAHAHGVVHRDVKPENILIEHSSGRPMVTDFGIARLAEASPLTATGQILGTVYFMSPEQVSGDAIDGRSDLYSLGVVGYLELSGRLPFDAPSASAVLVAHVTKSPAPLRDAAPELPERLAAVIDRCLAKRAEDRYADGEELARALQEAAAAAPADDWTAPEAPPVISESDAQELWRRAAELQALTGFAGPRGEPARPVAARPAPSLTRGYRMEDVRAAAVEAGISEPYVRRAAIEMGLERGPGNASPTTRAAPGTEIIQTGDLERTRRGLGRLLAGAPTALTYEARLDGEVPERDLELLLDTIRREIGSAGQVGWFARSLSWSTPEPDRRLTVTIVPRDGKTTIRIDERLNRYMGGIFGGVMGGVGGGAGGPLAALAGKFGGGLAAIATATGVIALAYGIARTTYVLTARSKDRQLHRLFDALCAQAHDSIASGAASGVPRLQGIPGR